MKTRNLWPILMAFPLFVACSSNNQDQADTVTTESRPNLVRAADGTYLEVDCLRENAQTLMGAASQAGYESAFTQAKLFCNVANYSQQDAARACAPTCQVGNSSYTSYFHPPAFWGGGNCSGKIDVNFNNYFFGGSYGYDGYQVLGFQQGQSYNPYPAGYQDYTYANYTQPQAAAQPFYYNTNYYNPPASSNYCGSSCLAGGVIANPYSPSTGSTNGCANTCWYATPTAQLVQ